MVIHGAADKAAILYSWDGLEVLILFLFRRPGLMHYGPGTCETLLQKQSRRAASWQQGRQLESTATVDASAPAEGLQFNQARLHQHSDIMKS